MQFLTLFFKLAKTYNIIVTKFIICINLPYDKCCKIVNSPIKASDIIKA